MANDTKVEIRGLRELRKALKQVDNELPLKLKSGFKEIATDVIGKIKPKVPFSTGKARASLKPRATQRGAGIAFGGSAAPYYPWLDFGGSTGKGHRTGQPYSGAIQRPFMKEGRYVYPTLREENQNINEAVDDLLEDLFNSAGFEQRGDG